MMEWKTVYVFVSSTFNDMHAERDLLVKRVFPELRLWCARRKLQLRDIDLRWGVSAADAQENKRVVEVCLRNIDKCRPFFLCFMGQRRGWVPKEGDVNPETLEAFPAISSQIGKASVTELEVLHALMQPLAPDAAPVRYARFYFRDDAYTRALRSTDHKNLFIPGRRLFRVADKGVEAFKKRLEQQYPTVNYTARWNPELPSPELTGALSKGRLEDFRVGGNSLESDVLEWLKKSIEEEYPDHRELLPAASELERELDRQDTQRFQCVDGYIPRPAEEQGLARSLEAAGSRPLVLLAQAGCGKTSLLAAFLQTQQRRPVYYRFVGTTPQSFRLEDLSKSLTEEWVRDGLLPENVLEYTPSERKLIFHSLCVQAAQEKPFLLVLDGMDQIQGGENWQAWLPKEMPEGASLLVSLRDTGVALPENMEIYRLGMMTDPRDKELMASGYLSNFLKAIDRNQMDQLLAMDGSDNPLYMKIVLNELRQHGSFDTLMELFSRDYGSTPLSAFSQVLMRVKRELKGTCFDADGAMFLFFCVLAHAQQGLDGQVFQRACRLLNGWDEAVISDRQVLDLVYGLARELEPFLVLDGDRIALRYDSLRQAIRQGYTEEGRQFANVLLAHAFYLQTKDSRDPEDARTSLMHSVSGTEEHIRALFRYPDWIVTMIRYGGAEMVAKSCDALIRQRNMHEFSDLAKVLRKAAARLDVNPNTLFMELDRFGDHDNPVTAALLRAGKDFDTGVMLRPRYQANAAEALCWEYAHPKSSSGCEVWAEPYFVYVSNAVLKVVDLRTQDTVHVMHLSRDARIKLAVDGETLFLCRFDAECSRVRISRYRLPDMQPLGETASLNCPYGAIWSIHAWNGKVYAMQFEPRGGLGRGGRYTASCLDTETVLFQEVIHSDFHYQLCGAWLVYRHDGSGIGRVLSLDDGKCLFEDQHLGTDHLDPELNRRLSPYGRLFANKANMYAACGDKLYIWKSGSRILPAGSIELMQRMHRLAPADGGLVLERTWTDELAHHCKFAVLGNQYLISESRGYVEIMDSDCHVLGKLDLGDQIHRPDGSNTHFALFDGQILMFHEDKIRSYDVQRFVSSLNPDLEEPFVGRRSSAVIDDRLYVMNLEMERIDLRTLELTCEQYTEKQFWEQYDPWNMQGQDLWVGYGTKSGYVTIKRPGSMERMVHFRMPDVDKRDLRCAFLYRDQNDATRICLVQTDKETTCRTFGREEATLTRVWLRTKPLLQLAHDTPWTERNLNVEMAVSGLGLDPVSTTANGKPYVIVPNVYKDSKTAQLRVYDLLENSWIYTNDIDLHNGFTLQREAFRTFPGVVVYCYGSRENKKLEVIDLTVPKVLVLNRGVNILTKDSLAKQMCLYDRDSQELLVYDIATRQMSKVTTIDKDFWPGEAVLMEDYVILTQSFRDTVRIYDRASGKLLCSQRLEVSPDGLMAHQALDTVAMVDGNCRKYFWTLETSGK